MKRWDKSIKGIDTPLGRVIAPIVDGQIRSFLNDHPEALGKMDARQFRVSLTKRILNDLLCVDSAQRMSAVLLGDGTDEQQAREHGCGNPVLAADAPASFVGASACSEAA